MSARTHQVDAGDVVGLVVVVRAVVGVTDIGRVSDSVAVAASVATVAAAAVLGSVSFDCDNIAMSPATESTATATTSSRTTGCRLRVGGGNDPLGDELSMLGGATGRILVGGGGGGAVTRIRVASFARPSPDA